MEVRAKTCYETPQRRAGVSSLAGRRVVGSAIPTAVAELDSNNEIVRRGFAVVGRKREIVGIETDFGNAVPNLGDLESRNPPPARAVDPDRSVPDRVIDIPYRDAIAAFETCSFQADRAKE